ncbi:MAG: TolC family protein [Gammaproteobacteria bacterium]|nr:TolC family protein [Gammaproteobacteria bacterium]MDE0414007.1 TolC family protein [Gammaproteobacteria bacterium]
MGFGRLCAAALALCFLGAAQTSTAAKELPSCTLAKCELTLNDAILLALERNRPLLNSRLDREVQRFSLEVAEDRYRPTFSLSPFANQDRIDRTAGLGARSVLRVPTGGQFGIHYNDTRSRLFEDSGSQTLSFSQPLLKGAWPGVATAPLRQARISERINVLSFRQTTASLIDAVIRAYRGLTGAMRQLEISESSLQRARQQLEATRALIGVGRVAEREAGRSEAAIANRELALVRARNQLENAQFRLISILELDSAIRIAPLEELTAEKLDTAFEAELDYALRNRNDYLSAGLGVDIAEIGLAVARNNMLPDLSLSFDWTERHTGEIDNGVRLNLTAPLPWNDRSRELQRMRARYALRKAERNVLELRESIGVSLRQAVNDVEVGFRLIELARNARELAERNLEVEGAKFSQGLSSTFEVAASEDDLVRAEQAEVDAIISYLDALTRLDQTTGRTLDRWGVEVEAFSP